MSLSKPQEPDYISSGTSTGKTIPQNPITEKKEDQYLDIKSDSYSEKKSRSEIIEYVKKRNKD